MTDRFPPIKSQDQLDIDEADAAMLDAYRGAVTIIKWLAVGLAVVFIAGQLAKMMGVM
jgi:hypothetical protein